MPPSVIVIAGIEIVSPGLAATIAARSVPGLPSSAFDVTLIVAALARWASRSAATQAIKTSCPLRRPGCMVGKDGMPNLRPVRRQKWRRHVTSCRSSPMSLTTRSARPARAEQQRRPRAAASDDPIEPLADRDRRARCRRARVSNQREPRAPSRPSDRGRSPDRPPAHTRSRAWDTSALTTASATKRIYATARSRAPVSFSNRATRRGVGGSDVPRGEPCESGSDRDPLQKTAGRDHARLLRKRLADGAAVRTMTAGVAHE